MSRRALGREKIYQNVAFLRGHIRKYRKSIIVLGVVFVVLLAGYGGWQLLQGKAIGTVSSGESAVTEAPREKEGKSLYKGKFVTFFHGDNYREKNHIVSSTGPLREQIFLIADDIEGRKIAVTVADYGVENTEPESAVQWRRTLSQEYREQAFRVGPWAGQYFVKRSLPGEITAFFSAGGYRVSFSLTSPFGADGLREELVESLATLRFSSE